MLIPGAGGNLRFANINYLQKMKFIRAFQSISGEFDYTILDLSAGITRTTLDFALIADYTLVVTTPEDIQTGYGCAKAAAERLRELEERYKRRDPGYHNYDMFSPLFVFNKADRDSAMGIFTGVLRASVVTQKKYGLVFRPRFLGYIEPFHKAMHKAYVQQHIPVTTGAPNSSAGLSFQTIAHFFLNNSIGKKRRIKENPLSRIVKLFRNEEKDLSFPESA
jgi:MinD-like ATPase involved in chromosome partitioning or flagellar assembly